MHDEAPATPFDSIESAHEYLALLCAEIVNNRAALDEAIAQATREEAARRLDVLRLIAYKLDRLHSHIESGSRLLNDLRTLRRLLLGERRRAPENQPRSPRPR